VPNRRVVIPDTMTLGENRISASLATFELVPKGNGTDLVFTEQAGFFEERMVRKFVNKGWGNLLERLGKELAHK
jgi:hypothetical protein